MTALTDADMKTLFEDYDITALRDPELFKGGMARQANWKMVSGTKLYNLSDDPGEQNNIADAHPEIMQKMFINLLENIKKGPPKKRNGYLFPNCRP